MDSVLVTGGAGYVGSHVCLALAKAGWRPVAFDDLSGGHAHLVRWGPLEVGDVGDARRLDAILASWHPRAILHCAITAPGGEPAIAWRRDVAGSLILLEAAVRHGIGAVVFSSSGATYGHPDTVPVAEDSPQRPRSLYARSKALVEGLLADFHAEHGLNYAVLRFFNAVGADPDGETGDERGGEPRLMTRALLAAAGLVPRLQVFGDDWPTCDGSCVRDYVHVSDVARWHVAAMEQLLAGGDPMTLNLGTGRGWSVWELVAAVERVTHRLVPVVVAPRRPEVAPVLVADPRRGMRQLEIAPELVSLDEMADTAWRWLAHRQLGRRF